MQKQGFNINVICIVLISLVLLMGLWNLTIFYIPVLLMAGLIGFTAIRNHLNVAPVSVISLFMLLLYETVNLQTSAYQANSILFLRDFLTVFCCIFLINKLLKNEKYKIYFVVFISIIAGLFAFFNIPIFFFRYYESTLYGFSDFSQFRFLYMPLGFFSNEWVTILFCFLPFPLIGMFLFWNKIWGRYGFLLIIGLIIFNILISFSRAGIIAFLLFILLLNFLFYFNRILTIKKLVLCNVVLILFLLLFAFCFSESVRSSVYQTNSHQRSTEGRLKQWKEVSTLTYTYPFFGIGSKNYALMGRKSIPINLENTFTGRLNNTYIQLVVEKGWVGLLLWLCVISILVFRLFRQIKKEKNLPDKVIDCILFSAALAVLFKEIFFSSLLYNSGILLLFFILLIFNDKNRKSINFRKSAVIIFVAIFTSGTAYLYFHKPDNALLYASKGLEYERSDSIDKAIQCYKDACRLSPADAMFKHNLGRLYGINQQPDSALFYLSQAINTDPNIALFYISRGLFIEAEKPDEAFETYKQAILLSPNIMDSQFFKDLQERNPAKTEELLINASYELLQMLSVRYSSIIEAKSGKLLLSLGETDRAYEAFNHVTQIHPNLNRPWYYLGMIEQEKGKFDAMQTCYKKSLFLSPNDHLPLYAFAQYYKEIGDTPKSESYTQSAERVWQNKRSFHSIRSKWMYYSETDNDDVVPQGLLDYITPVFSENTHDKN